MRRISTEPTPSSNLLTYLLQAYSGLVEIRMATSNRNELNKKGPKAAPGHAIPPEASVQHELHAVQATLS